MNGDEHGRLLIEIRDILRNQTELIQSNWVEHRKLANRSVIASITMALPFGILVAWLIVKDF